MKQGKLFTEEREPAAALAPPGTRCFFRGDNLEVMRAWDDRADFTGETYLFFSEGNIRWLKTETPGDDADIAVFLAACLPVGEITQAFLDAFDWPEAIARFRAWDGQPPRLVPHPVARILRDTDLYVFQLKRKTETKIVGGEPRRSEKAG